ncbi:MAG TPA: hypothetical protein VGF45_16010, partial [Polyangia bacterium]
MGTSRSPRPTFTDADLELLFSEIQHFTRAFTLYWLAFRLGLSARQLSALDVRDISTDGREAAHAVHVKRARSYRSAREGLVPVPIDTRGVVRRYLNWRRECIHFRLPMRTYRDATGNPRCHVCREPIDFLYCPLFATARRGRLSPKTMQNGFALIRDQLGLNRALRF